MGGSLSLVSPSPPRLFNRSSSWMFEASPSVVNTSAGRFRRARLHLSHSTARSRFLDTTSRTTVRTDPYTAVRMVMLSTLGQRRKSERGEISIRQGVIQSRALTHPSLAAPGAGRRTSSAYRLRPLLPCCKNAFRRRLLIHEPNPFNTERVSQKPKQPRQPRRYRVSSSITCSLFVPCSHRRFRGLPKLHTRYCPPDCSPTIRGLCRRFQPTWSTCQTAFIFINGWRAGLSCSCARTRPSDRSDPWCARR